MVEGLGCCGSTQEGGGVGDIKYPNAYGGFRFLFPIHCYQQSLF